MSEAYLKVAYSQHLETLAEALIAAFFNKEASVFASRLIVVPHAGMKEYLLGFFARHPQLQIAMGLQILPLNQAVMEIVDRNDCMVKRIPSLLELTVAIEHHLLEIDPLALHDPHFREYVLMRTTSPQKIKGFASELAKIFTRYGLFGEEFLSSWLLEKGWQQELWKRIFKDWTYPLAFFSALPPVEFTGEIALFGFCFIPRVHLRFFASLKASCYLFSPCSLFWTDVVSDRQRLQWNKRAKGLGVSAETREAMQGYMQSTHPLLANWGNMGKQMAAFLDQESLIEEDFYLLPAPSKRLSSLQHSLLTLSSESPRFTDNSIQIHSATSALREVEIVRDVIESLMQQDALLRPEDILVLAPDISSYGPLIKMVFDSSPLLVAVEGKEALPSEIKGFLALLRLPKEQYAVESITALLSCPFFREKVNLSLEDVEKLIQGFSKARILFDLSGHPQSWKEGLDRLLYGLVQSTPEKELPWPIDCIPHADIDIWSRFLEVFTQLQEDLKLLGAMRSFPEWLVFLMQVRQRYFLADEQSQRFFTEIESWRKSLFAYAEKVWSFDQVYAHIEQLAVQMQESNSLFSWDKVLFSSIDKAPFKPAKVIWCLGLDEEAFPLVEVGSSLDQMQKNRDSFPSRSDQDRFAFLEMILKAQQYLILSYVRIDRRDSKEKGMSLLIQELNEYLSPHALAPQIHPDFPLDASYFLPEATIKRWSQSDYLAAARHYGVHSKRPLFFAPKISLEKPQIVTIAQLKKCARHPLQLYCNQTLQLFLERQENEEEEEFVLSSLKKGLWRKEGFNTALYSILDRVQSEGQLPVGRWRDVAITELQEEIEGIQVSLTQLQLEQSEIFTLRFCDCLEAESSLLIRPALRVGSLSIEGELEGVTAKGLLFAGSSTLSDLMRVWPLYLLYLQLYPQSQQLLLAKEGISLSIPVKDPPAELASYLDFYLEALAYPCPLIVSSANVFLEGDLSAFKGLLEKEQEDVYWNYLKRRGALVELEENFSYWQPKIQSLFQVLIKEVL